MTSWRKRWRVSVPRPCGIDDPASARVFLDPTPGDDTLTVDEMIPANRVGQAELVVE